MNTKATVRIKDKEMARSLANEFFQGLTSIKITGNGGTAEIFFDENPQEIINSIVDSIIKEDETLELECSRASNAQKKPIEREIVKKEIKVAVEAEETKMEDAIVVPKEPRQDEGTAEEKIVNDKKSEIRLKVIPEIPELKEVLEGSASLDEDAEKVSNWLGIEDRWNPLFVNLIKAATLVEKITWDSLAEVLELQGFKCGSYERAIGRNAIKKGLVRKNITITLSKFIKALVKGQDSKKTKHEQKTKKEDVEEKKVPKQEQDTKELYHLITRQRNEVTIWCNPHITFNVDPNQTEDNMVNLVLTTMGLGRFKLKTQNSEKESDNIRKIIFEVCNTAVKMNLEENDIKSICEKVCEKAQIDCTSTKAKMLLSQFINDFFKKNNVGGLIRVNDFLSDLQKVIFEN